MERAVAALGGAQFLSVHDRVAAGWVGSWKGPVSRHIRTKIYTLYSPGGVWERQAFDRNESHAVLFNESGGYEITFRGVHRLHRERVEQYQEEIRNSVLSILRQGFGHPELGIEYLGARMCGSEAGDLVELRRDPFSSGVTVCFSRATGLPVRQWYYRKDLGTGESTVDVTIFSRYTDAGDGVQWPRQILLLRNGNPVSEVFLDAVHVNQGVGAELFRVPAGARGLPPRQAAGPEEPGRRLTEAAPGTERAGQAGS